MAPSGQLSTPSREPEDSGSHQPRRGADVRLSPPDRRQLRAYAAEVAPNEAAAHRWLRQIGFPAGEYPAWTAGMNAGDWWDVLFNEFDLGVAETPYRDLIEAFSERYPHGAAAGLRDRCLQPPAADPPPQPTTNRSDLVHVMFRASTDEESLAAQRALSDSGLDPHQLYATQHAVSFSVGTGDAAAVSRRLRGVTDLGWTVIAPGTPDYVLRNLYFQVPDGTHYQTVDASSASTLGDLAADVMTAHRVQGRTEAPTTAEEVPTVVERVMPDGSRRRENPDQTVHEADLRDGDQLRIGVRADAGAVHPHMHEDGLHRAHHQILRFAQEHPGLQVRPRPAGFPSEYELEFDRPGFGPPESADAGPALITHHLVRIELGPEFPETHPLVYWVTPIFHPNVYPNYECPKFHEHPEARGLVCLGELDKGWYPALDFAEICQMIVDIAGYGNYDLYRLAYSERLGMHRIENFYNKQAADWAETHQDEIVARGGVAANRLPTDWLTARPRGSRSVVHPLD